MCTMIKAWVIGHLLIIDRDLFFAITIAIWSKDQGMIVIAKFNDRDSKNTIFLEIFWAFNIVINFQESLNKLYKIHDLNKTENTFSLKARAELNSWAGLTWTA